MKVVISEAAIADILQIGGWIKASNPARVETFVAELYGRCRQLGTLPQAYPLLPNWEDRGIRRCVHGSYLIFYRVGKEAVDVLHILHGARDGEEIIFPDG